MRSHEKRLMLIVLLREGTGIYMLCVRSNWKGLPLELGVCEYFL